MLFNNLRKENYFIEKDFIELRDSVKNLIDAIEKYKDMRKDSDRCIMELKEFLEEVNLVLEEKSLTKKELTNLHLGRRSIQLGIRGEAVVKYVNEWIVKITDITDEVKRIKQSIDNGTFKESFLPEEKEYIVK